MEALLLTGPAPVAPPSSPSLSSSPSSKSSPSMALSSPFFGSPMQSAILRKTACRGVSRPIQIVATDSAKRVVPYANYAVPLEPSKELSFITRSLAEILRDMNKRVPDKILKVKNDEGVNLKYIPWYHANRMLSFYAPGWSGEVRSMNFSPDGSSVTVVYRVTIRGSDGELWRESSGSAAMNDIQFGDPVQKAEGMAFRRACARFGLGLYLYHEDEVV